MNFETLFIIVIFLSIFFYYIMTQNCRNIKKETFSQLKNINIKNNTKRNKKKNSHKKYEEGFQNQLENNNLLNNKKSVLKLFYSKTCPHSMNFIPIWEKLKQMKKENIEFESVEGDSDENDEFIKYNIKHLPTIILQFEGKTDFNVYKGDRSIKDIITFLRLNGINLNTTILEGFKINRNLGDDDNNYICDYSSPFEFEKGVFNFENGKFKLKIKGDVIHEIDEDKEEDTFPVYMLVSFFIDKLRNDGLNDDDIAYELNKCNIKKFLKNLKYGLCYNNTIEKLKKLYKDSIVDLEKINLIEKKVCNNDNFIIKKQFDRKSLQN